MSFPIILSAIAIVVSIYSLVQSIKQSRITRRIEIEQLLHDAWDLMGGKKGTDMISNFSIESDLILARRNIEKALMINPKHAKSQYLEAVLFEGLGDHKNSEKSYLKAIKLSNGKISNAYIYLGRLYHKQGEIENALAIYEKGLKKCKHKSEILFNIGVIYYEKNELDIAIKKFKESIIENQSFSRPYANLIAIYGIKGEHESAKEFINSAIKNNADDLDVYRNASALFQKLGDKEQFEKMHKKYVSLGNDNIL